MTKSKFDPFAAPVPGHSLTLAPGSMPYEQPPQYTNEDDAMYSILNSMTKAESAFAISEGLERGIFASDIANAVLIGGISEGKWTPDLAALIAKRTLASVVAVGASQGVKKIRYKKPKSNRSEVYDILSNLEKISQEDEVEDVVSTEQVPEVSIKGVMADG